MFSENDLKRKIILNIISYLPNAKWLPFPVIDHVGSKTIASQVGPTSEASVLDCLKSARREGAGAALAYFHIRAHTSGHSEKSLERKTRFKAEARAVLE